MFEVYNLVWYHIINKDQVLQHLVHTIGLDGIFPFNVNPGNKNPPSATNLRVGFYFLLLLFPMYVKSAIINIPKRNMIVIASFTSMASPPFEGKTMPTQDSIVPSFYL